MTSGARWLPMRLLDHGQRRREPAVESDHQHRRRFEAAVHGRDPIELVPGQRERLLDEHVLARFERTHDLIGVLVCRVAITTRSMPGS